MELLLACFVILLLVVITAATVVIKQWFANKQGKKAQSLSNADEVSIEQPSFPEEQPVVEVQHVDLPYVARKQLLSNAERTFFDVVRRVAPEDTVIYPQMRLASIIDVRSYAKRQYTHFNRIQAKCVDFVLCDLSTSAPLLVIELDDSSHARKDRKERDQFVDAALHAANLPILHVPWQRHYDPDSLNNDILRLLGRSPFESPVPPMPKLSFLPQQEQVQPKITSCSRCKQTIHNHSRFCSACGAAL